MAVTYEHIYNTLYGVDKSGRQQSPNLEISLAYIPMSGPKFASKDKLVAYLQKAKTQTVPEGPNKGELVRHSISRVDLADSDIHGAHLPGALIQFTLMNDTNLDGLTYSGGEFRHNYMGGASLRNAHLEEVLFQLSNLERADFSGADLSGSKFVQPALKDAVFCNAVLDEIDLSGQDLRGVDFTGASMKNMNLRGADLRGAVFDGANMQGADLTYARMDLRQLAHVAARPAIGPAGKFSAGRMRRLRHPAPGLA